MDYAAILVPIDGSDLADRALHPAAAIARRTGAGVVLYAQAERDDALAQQEASLQEAAAGLEDVDVAVRADTAASPALGIEQQVAQLDRPLVCMSSHGRGGIGQALLGSVAEETLRRLACPIVLVGPGCAAGASAVDGPLVATLDGSKVSESILEPALGWARACEMPVTLVQVVAESWEAEVAAAGVDPGDVQEDSYLRGLARRFGGEPIVVDWDVLRHRDPRKPAAKLVEYLKGKDAGLMAMSTHGRTGLRRLVIGSVAMRVVHDSPCPVLIARPSQL